MTYKFTATLNWLNPKLTWIVAAIGTGVLLTSRYLQSLLMKNFIVVVAILLGLTVLGIAAAALLNRQKPLLLRRRSEVLSSPIAWAGLTSHEQAIFRVLIVFESALCILLGLGFAYLAVYVLGRFL